ncbi:MAG: 4-alpha-glucanotransferase [Leptospirales bacterium]|nr:4-alpha-glucanotransferase [Leptospirales bacterium]
MTDITNERPPEKSYLDKLSDLGGIAPEYFDIDGVPHRPSAEAKASVLNLMRWGGDPEYVFLRESERIWNTILEPSIVLPVGALTFYMRLPGEIPVHEIEFSLELEGGLRIGLRPATTEVEQFSSIASGRFYRRVEAFLADQLPPGGHTLILTRNGAELARSALFICPEDCYIHHELNRDQPWNGIWLQLYALKSQKNWGIGDLGDLLDLARSVADSRVRLIGLSPLHTPFFLLPESRSPYSPSSRLFKNPIFIDIPALGEFQECEEARDQVLTREFLDFLKRCRSEDRIDYRSVFIWKFRFFEILFNDFLYKYTDSYENPTAERITFRDKGIQFAKYLEDQGEMLRRQAIFDTLEERFRNPEGEQRHTGFHGWPAEFQDVNSSAVADFALVNQKRILFYSYLQYLFDKQFSGISWLCGEMGISLYADLAVGSHPGGAEVWSRPGAYCRGASIGAPPDPLGPQGQDWGLVPLNPQRISEERYAAFMDILEKNLPEGGVVRIDHVMSLCRLYWVVPTPQGKEGAYVGYPFEDLLRLLALVSQRNKCMVIGEDLGTVPDYFRAALKRAELFSWKIVFFERESERFHNPEEYPERSIATINTHDLPTFYGWLAGEDIRIREELKIVSEHAATEMRAERELEIRMARDLAGFAAEDEAVPGEFCARLYERLLRSGSGIRLVSLYDLFGEMRQPNLPGTTDEYPCWAHRNERPISELTQQPLFRRLFLD